MSKKFLSLICSLLAFCLASPVAASKHSEITIGTIVYKWQDLENQFKTLHENGFTSCQINYNSGMDENFAKRVRAASKKYKLRVTTIVGVPGHSRWNFTQGPSTIGLVPQTPERQQKIETYHKMIDLCKLAGVPAIHSHFGFIPEDCSSEQYKDFIRVMTDLNKYALSQGVKIYFETGQETPITLVRALTDINKATFGDSCDVLQGNCFINCDVANLLLYGKANPTDAIRLFGPLVKELHAKDGTYPNYKDPYHLGKERPIPQGDVDFPAIIKILKDEGFSGALTIECEMNTKNANYLDQTRQYLQNLLDKE